MAKILSNSGIVTGQPVEAQHVSQSVNALTGAEAYDITISGSLSVTGPVIIDGLTNDAQINVITFDPVTKQLHYTGSANLNIPTTNTFPYTGSAIISGSLTLTGSFNATGGLTGSLLGTASNAVSASYASTASYVLNAVSSSFASTASYVKNTVSASYAATASYVLNSVSASYASTASYVVTAQTASYVVTARTASFVTASNVYGPFGSNSILSASYAATASYVVTAQTASYVLNAVSASYVLNAQTASYVQNAQTASYILNAVSSSYALTASYILNAVSASYVKNAQTASYVLNAVSASYVLNAISSSFASTASYVKNAQTASYLAGAILQNGNVFGTTVSIGSQDSNDLNFLTNNLVRTTISSSGNVGIGTTTPTELLDVNGTIRSRVTNGVALYLGNESSNGVPSVDGARILYEPNTFGTNLDGLVIEKTDNNSTYPDGGIMFANVGNDGVRKPSLSILGSGRIGIGVTSSNYTLEVQTSSSGAESIFAATTYDSEGYFDIVNGTAVAGTFTPVLRGTQIGVSASALSIQARGEEAYDSGSNAYMTFNARYSNAVISSSSTRPLFTFVNYTTTLMQLMANGNVGIGNDAYPPLAKLHINNTTTSASFLVEDSTNPDSTPFIIDASGNVGIGKSIPTSSLDVSGNVTATTYTASVAVGSVGFLGTASWAVSSSRAITASYALTSINVTPAGALYDIQYNNNTVLGATSSFNYSPVYQSLQQGNGVSAIGQYSHAEGWNTQAKNNYAHAEGVNSLADGLYAHAEGHTTTATGQASHAEGLGTLTSGTGAHAEGSYTTASGNYSHAEGAYTISLGPNSHAEGYFTVASGSYQHVQGQFNRQGDTTSLMIVGNGTSDVARSDAFRVRMSGSIVLPTTRSAAPSWTGTDGEMVFATVTGNHRFYVWMAGAWRSGSLS
jgi:hypothetical protein